MENPSMLINDSTLISSENLIGFKGKVEFEKILNHLRNLILSSKKLLDSEFFTQSLFLSITALEEIAKIEVCVYRGFQNRELIKKAKDPLFSHKSKHFIAADPIILIGNRLQNSIGEERIKEILINLQSGKFVEIRENCLYFQRNQHSLKVPDDVIDIKLAFEILLVVIEMTGDKFWGLSKNASTISDELYEIYPDIENQMKLKT
ncbi:AbiV family abortive infection protein [Flavobacterium sp. 28A]|uniref:AbiV family abortive infection protein n=1 Tax=Flavobacterium sp. 28A TaxID=2735895 RepID=UPI00157103E4|nr:AbiV family abortive infection protein [Flavobacterium sp. 28A]NRT15194.1 AbiV family abortive infection protein [Flavobacterium sp. 28A]